MDHGAWPCFVDGVTCLVNSVSVCEEKKKREDEREEKREKMKKKREKMNEIMKRDKDERKSFFFAKNVSRPSNPPDELAQNVSKKNPFRTNYSSFFSAKVQNLAVFSFIYMIRIRFFGPQELIQNGFRAGQ